jgi:hypothetical protein
VLTIEESGPSTSTRELCSRLVERSAAACTVVDTFTFGVFVFPCARTFRPLFSEDSELHFASVSDKDNKCYIDQWRHTCSLFKTALHSLSDRALEPGAGSAIMSVFEMGCTALSEDDEEKRRAIPGNLALLFINVSGDL